MPPPSIPMDLTLLLQYTVNGLLMGGVYALVAVGLTLIYGVMKIINFAHGEFLTAGMYVAYWFFVLWRVDPYVSVLVSMVVLFLLGAIVERFLVEPVLPAPQLNQILLTLGVSLFLMNLMMVAFSPNTRTVHVGLSTASVTIHGIVLGLPRLVAFGMAMVLSMGLYVFLRLTRLGRAVRAATQDREGAQLVGVDVRRIFMVAFGIGAALAATAGALITPFYSVQPLAGTPFVLTAYVIVVLGTMGHFLGALFGALIIGVAESLGAFFLSPAVKQLVSFAIFILVLLFKPAGLFGGRTA